MLRVFSMSLLLVACSGDEPSVAVDAQTSLADGMASFDAMANAVDATTSVPDAGLFALTSAAYAEGAAIPVVHSCRGANTSPPLAWGNAPAGTQSFAVVFNDTSNNFLHSAIWDIPADRMSLPAAVELAYEPGSVPGAKQPVSYLTDRRGYAGPCPQNEHVYEFTLHALGVPTVLTLGESSTRGEVRAAVEAASLGQASLTGSFDPG